MKYVRFVQEDVPCWGRIEGDRIIVQSGTPLLRGCHHDTLENLPVDSTPLLPPCEPSKIVCVGRNYREHASELGNAPPKEPLIFLKPPSAVLATGAAIVLPPISQRVDYEGELAVVIGSRCSHLRTGEDIRPYIFGFTCLNDVTARDLQQQDGQWTRGKGFDSFCPFGPWIETAPQKGDKPWHGLGIRTTVNGEIRQQGNTADFIFSLEEILLWITAVMTLEPGDIVSTGTPAGVGPLHAGDRVAVTVEGIGTLENSVIASAK
jgi:2-keto-4-pentenoate hydratase/2-oxohepta-3-ene-1,7-dioic acid hydratase in catechol pathway